MRFVVRRWIRNPLRVAFLVLSIGVATTLWTAVTRVAFSSVESFEKSIGVADKRYQIRVSARGGRLDRRRLRDALAALPKLTDVVFLAREAGLVARKRGTRVSEDKKPFTIVGVGGMSAENVVSVPSDRVAISESGMRNLGVTVGDSVMVWRGSEARTLTVEQLPTDSNSRFSESAVVSLGHFSEENSFDEALIAFGQKELSNQEFEDFQSWLRSATRSELVLAEPLTAPLERAQEVTAAYRFNIVIVAAMSLCVCALLVYQATQLSFIALARELSILRIVGVSAVEIGSALILEAAIMSVLGALIGLVVGYPATLYLTKSLLETAYQLYGVEFAELSRSESVLRGVITVFTIALVSCASATIAAVRAVCGGIASGARRERVHVRPLSSGLQYGFFVIVSTEVALILLMLTLYPSVVLTYAALVSLLVWVATAGVSGLVAVPAALSSRRAGVPRMLAFSLLKRSGGSYVFGVIASSVAIALMTSLACMVGSFRGTLRDWSRVRLQGDLFLSSAIAGEGNENLVSERVIGSVRAHPDVLRVIAYREARDVVNSRDVIIAGTDIRAQCARGVYIFMSGSCRDVESTTLPYVVISESAARKCALERGQRISLQGKNLLVAAVLREFSTEQPLFITDEAVFTELYGNQGAKTLTIDLSDTVNVEHARKSLMEALTEPVILRDHRELLRLVEEIFNRTFTITESVRWVVFILAVGGLVAGYIQHIWERRLDLRVLDVQGMHRSEHFCMFCLEACCLVAIPIVAGGGAGLILGYTLTEYLNPLVFGWRLQFDSGASFGIEVATFALLSVASMVGGAMILLQVITKQVGLRDE